MRYRDAFKMPVKMKITGRSSSITNSFVSSIIPSIKPEEADIRECLRILELDPDNLRCAYCGDTATQWDHLRPLVSGKKPTGYISEIRNLVPTCGKCNQSKGNKYWKDWIKSNAKRSPKTRQVKDLDSRIKRLERYEKWGKVSPIDFATMVDKKLWRQHWQNCEDLHKKLERCQEVADKVRTAIEKNSQTSRLSH